MKSDFKIYFTVLYDLQPRLGQTDKQNNMLLESLLSFASRVFLSSRVLSTCLDAEAKKPRQVSCALGRKPVLSQHASSKTETCVASADEVARLAGTLDTAERKELLRVCFLSPFHNALFF